MSDDAIGIDIGGTKTAAALVDSSSRIVARVESATPAQSGPEAILDMAAELARSIDTGSALPVIGVASAGVLDRRGLVTHATDHLRGWRGTDLAGGLSARLGRAVRAGNDVHVAALSEVPGSGGTGLSTLFVAIGTGIGGAMIIGDRVMVGSRGTAGMVGHVVAPGAAGRACSCGGAGHVEAIASGTALERQWVEKTGQGVRLADIAELARGGDERAGELLHSSFTALGSALADAIAVTGADEIAFSGGVSRLGPLLTDPVRAALESAWPDTSRSVAVRIAAFDHEAALVGAAALARRADETWFL